MNEMFALGRRALLGHMALALGAAALPLEALAAPSPGTGPHLPKARYDLLVAVADTLLPVTDTPGALAAEVPARIDGLLANWASPETRKLIEDALDRIDVSARAVKGKGFHALSARHRAEVLRPHDAEALKPVPGAQPSSPFSQVPIVGDAGYLKLKNLVIALYYFSETGSAHELRYEHVPGPFEPSVKLTPQSRPFLGNSPF